MINEITESFIPIMSWLADLFQSHPVMATYYTTVVRFIFVALALFVVFRAIRSLLAAKSPPEVFGYLSVTGGNICPILHWENVIGRDRSADIHVDVMTVSRNHGTLVRNSRDQWFYSDLGSKGGSRVNGKKVFDTAQVRMGDHIELGGVDCVLMPPSLEERRHNLDIREQYTRPFRPWASLVALTLFQFLTCIQFLAARGSDLPPSVLMGFAGLTVAMWVYCIILSRLGQIAFEMETIAFFLCTLNMAVVSASKPGGVFKELVAILLGMVLFLCMCWYLRDLSRGLGIRRLLVVLSALLFMVNIVFGSSEYGAVNWVSIGGYNLQPSELVKIAYIFIGAGTLDELYKRKNLYLFVGFSIFSLGCLAVMNDFGTAAIYFVTFVVIAFLRSGEFSKLFLIGGVTGVGVLLMIRFVPHITQRFATWRHAWDYPDAGGFQQVRGMAASASGGCFGLGAGNGWFHTIFAADTDLVFPLVCEEWGLIIALLMIFCLVTLGLFAVRSIRFGRSTFYTIAACAATSLIIFQSMMNVLGSLDIFPFTGVTLPFISNGGTSMMASWGLLAFLKAADTRQNASLAVRSTAVSVEDSFRLYDDEYDDEYDDTYLDPPEGSRADRPARAPRRLTRADTYVEGISDPNPEEAYPYDDYDPYMNDPYGSAAAKKVAQDYDALYGEGTGTRRRSRRSQKNRNLDLGNAQKWLQLDADGPQRTKGTGKAKKSGATGTKSDARKSGGKRTKAQSEKSKPKK